MKDFYQKNLDAIETVNTHLYESLKSKDQNIKFEVYQGEKYSDINIYDSEKKMSLYAHPAKDIDKQEKESLLYREYPYLYFYGIGNGLLFERLLKNKKHEKIVVIEPELELFYIALHFIDVSKDIRSTRLVLLIDDMVSFPVANKLFSAGNAAVYAKVFKLHLPFRYYEENYLDKYVKTNSVLMESLTHVVFVSGNNVTDSLVGLKQHIHNFKFMLENTPYKTLHEIKQSEVAVIVSTGPSLYKQLALLKKVQDYVTIVSVDASFPILAKAGIQPDFCVSIERETLTAQFFKDTPDECHKDVVLLSASLQHQEIYDSFKGDNIVLVMRPFPYNKFFKLDDYGYIGYGMSAANMAFEFAVDMGCKEVILIGQDLAYGKDGKSHSEGHIFGADEITDGKSDFGADLKEENVIAYGGDGTVKTHELWKIYKQFFEHHIALLTSCSVYNCTEGGARIEGTKEVTFSEVVEIILNKSTKKAPIILSKPTNEVIKKYEEDAIKVLISIVNDGRKLQKELEAVFLQLMEKTKKLELNQEKKYDILSIGETIELMTIVEKIRKRLEEDHIYNGFFHEIIKPYVLHLEMGLAIIKVRYIDNPKDNQKKAVDWILEHRYWLYSIAGGISNVIDTIVEENPFDQDF